jgi:multidrug resistance protein MdtO
MATKSTYLPHAARFTTWFSDFLRKELAPYPGRGAVVARMVISATITTILVVTFRIPGGAIGALCAFLLSRESLLSTSKSALYFVLAFVLGGAFIPVGGRLFASVPITHFVWEAVSIFMLFFLLRTMTNYVVAIGLCAMTTNIFSIWYVTGPGLQDVELSLWQVGATLIGVLVTLTVEIIFYSIYPHDEVMDGVDVRLKHIEDLMGDYAANRPPSPETSRMLAQYAVVGVGTLRAYITRESDRARYRTRTSALVSLTGRSIDFAAALASTISETTTPDRQRAAELAKHIAEIRQCLKPAGQPSQWEASTDEGAGTPLLSELEAIISLIPSIFSDASAIDPLLQVLDNPPSSNRLFVEDAFTNPEHLRFVLGGTLAAMICYVLYVALDWPGISTSVTTCVFTALSNVGTSRQKQVLRIVGASLGGFVFGIGSQMFILPNIDSITGLAMLFAVVTGIAAWFSTSSTRLSYVGLQIALAFYLINLSEFSFQTSLTLGRDRAVGVLLGIFAMWLVFERLYPRPASDEMVRVFIRNLRLMAELITVSPAGTDTQAILKVRRQREQVYRNFGEVAAQTDAVPFETGRGRAADMAARDRIRHWQASIRTFYLLEAPLIQFRVFGDIGQKSKAFASMDDIFRVECAHALERMADSLENQLNKKPYERVVPRNLGTLLESSDDEQSTYSEREQALLRMLRTIASLVDRMQDEVAAEPLYATALNADDDSLSRPVTSS